MHRPALRGFFLLTLGLMLSACGGDDTPRETEPGIDSGGDPAVPDAGSPDALSADASSPEMPQLICGDGIINGGEACDGSALATRTCESEGFYQGTLSCSPQCQVDLSGCSGSCGDGIINGPETCDVALEITRTCRDQGFLGGLPRCAVGCEPAGCSNRLRMPEDADIALRGPGNFAQTVVFMDVNGDDLDDLLFTSYEQTGPNSRGAVYLVYGTRDGRARLGEAVRFIDPGWNEVTLGAGLIVADAGRMALNHRPAFAIALGSGAKTYLVDGGRYSGTVDLSQLAQTVKVTTFTAPDTDSFIARPGKNIHVVARSLTDANEDLVIGAWGQANATGTVYVLRGSRVEDSFSVGTHELPAPGASLPAGSPATAMLVGARPGQEFGRNVDGGDLDGDGALDLVVTGRPNQVFVFYGPLFGVRGSAQADAVISGPENEHGLYITSIAVGDVDGDFLDDLVIGEEGDGASVRLFKGGTRLQGNVSLTSSTVRLPASSGNDHASLRVAMGARRSGERRDLLVVDSFLHDFSAHTRGRVYLMSAPFTDGALLADSARQLSGPAQGETFARDLAQGDFDGDHSLDIAFGSPLELGGSSGDTGALYLVHGRAIGAH